MYHLLPCIIALPNKRVQSAAAAAAGYRGENWLCNALRIEADFGKVAARLTRSALERLTMAYSTLLRNYQFVFFNSFWRNMLYRLSNWLYAQAKGWLILILFIVLVLFMAITIPHESKKMKAVSPNSSRGLDTHFFYSPEKAFSMLDSYSDAGRILYLKGLLKVDIVIPILYTSFLSLFISWLYQRGFKSKSFIRNLNVIPVFVGLLDILENIAIITMLSMYPSKSVIMAWLNSIFTSTKLILACASILLVLIGLSKASVNKFREQWN